MFFVLKKCVIRDSAAGVKSTKRLWGISFSSFYNILHYYIITIYIYITILISLVAERNAPFSLHLSISISKQLSCFLFTRWVAQARLKQEKAQGENRSTLACQSGLLHPRQSRFDEAPLHGRVSRSRTSWSNLASYMGPKGCDL